MATIKDLLGKMIEKIDKVNDKCNADLVIKVNGVPHRKITNDMITIVEGSLLGIEEMFINNKTPNVELHFVYNDGIIIQNKKIKCQPMYYNGTLIVTYFTHEFGSSAYIGEIDFIDGTFYSSNLRNVTSTEVY